MIDQETQQVPQVPECILYAPKKKHHVFLSIGEQGFPPEYSVEAQGTAEFVSRVAVAAAEAFENDSLR